VVTVGAVQLEITAKLGTVDIDIVDYEIIDELNQLSKFKIVVANTYDNRQTIKNGISNTLYLYRDGGIQFFKGKIDVDKITFDRNRITLEGYDSNVILTEQYYQRNQGQYDYRRVQFDNIAANTIAGYVKDDANTAYTASYTVAECPVTLISLRGEYENHLKWIAEIAHAAKWTGGDGKKHSHEWYIDSSSGIHIVQQRGSAKGAIPSLEVDQNERAYSMIGNAGYGFGYGDGINQLKSSKTNAGSISLYRRREFQKIDRRYEIQTSIDDEIQRLVDENGAPVDSFKATMPTADWWENSMSVGDTVTVDRSDLEISSSTYRIMKAAIKPVVVELEITNRFKSVPQQIRDIAESRRVDAGYMQGATNIFMVGPLLDNFERIDGTTFYPLTLKIYIPTQAKTINKVLLNWTLSAFRGYTTAANSQDLGTKTSAAGGGTTQTSGNPSATHTHSVPIPNWSSGDYYIIGLQFNVDLRKNSNFTPSTFGTNSNSADHNHNVTIPNHTHDVLLGSHNHSNNYGIQEDTDTAPVMELKVGSTVIGSAYSGNQQDIDITAYVTTGWNTVLLYPAVGQNKRGRAQLDSVIQVFIESK